MAKNLVELMADLMVIKYIIPKIYISEYRAFAETLK